MSEKIYQDGNGNEIVYVRKKPTTEDPEYGAVSPCLANMLHYAISSGYEQCDPPDEMKPVESTVAPEPVASDSSVVAPEPVAEEPPATRKSKK